MPKKMLSRQDRRALLYAVSVLQIKLEEALKYSPHQGHLEEQIRRLKNITNL